ncbi:MAG TPA: ATP-binding protein, partial [Jatrophihabitans sp.]|nr:ATP-binding protein [Jatrophihabitans sp.]
MYSYVMSRHGGPAPLIGRDAELATGRRLLDAARAGAGHGLLVSGEAGIGKSRLILELSDDARSAGMTVLSGHAVPGGATYRAVASALLGQRFDPGLRTSPALRPFRAALTAVLPGWGGELAVTDASALDPALALAEGLRTLLD